LIPPTLPQSVGNPLFTKIFGDHINAMLAQQGIKLGAIRPKIPD
jgi:hypothetical protein